MINEKCNSNITGQEIDRIDHTITCVLNAARKHTEGMQRPITNAPQKVIIRSTLLHHSALHKQSQGKQIDENALEGRRKFLGIEEEILTNEQTSQKHNEAQQKWEEFIKQSKEEKENKLMDFYPRNINNDTEQNQNTMHMYIFSCSLHLRTSLQ